MICAEFDMDFEMSFSPSLSDHAAFDGPKQALVPLSADGYFVFFGAMALLIALMMWALGQQRKRARAGFLSQFDPAELRMSPYKTGIVYHVVGETADDLQVVAIWDNDCPVRQSDTYVIPKQDLIPFDPSRFLD